MAIRRMMTCASRDAVRLATFVATATTQALEFDTSSNAPILNAYVLREVAPVPEPGTLALMLCGLLGTAAVSRRRPD